MKPFGFYEEGLENVQFSVAGINKVKIGGSIMGKGTFTSWTSIGISNSQQLSG